MTFGQQAGPPASAKQVQYLLALVQKAGHTSFRDARGPLGLTQRQASGKFTRTEASTLIDHLVQAAENDDEVDGDGGSEVGSTTGRFNLGHVSATARLEAEQLQVLRGMPAGLIAGELERRGWTVTAPAVPAPVSAAPRR